MSYYIYVKSSYNGLMNMFVFIKHMLNAMLCTCITVCHTRLTNIYTVALILLHTVKLVILFTYNFTNFLNA